MNIVFCKWNGLGNDFILVEPEKNPGFDAAAAARRLCDRHFGIGADGLVTVRPLPDGSFEMKIYNSDGSECEMCGNATRCVARYLRRARLTDADTVTLHTGAGPIRPTLLADGRVRVDMGTPRLKRGEIPVAGDPEATALELPVEFDGRTFTGHAVSMGNPHVVFFVDDIAAVRLVEWGSRIERHALFPRKVNVEFVQVLAPDRVRMRVWERGCGITLACGTGSCATAVAGFLTGRTGRRVVVELDGGALEIEYADADGHVYMTGPAVEVFSGQTHL